jgi:oligopeptide transport system permease protein
MNLKDFEPLPLLEEKKIAEQVITQSSYTAKAIKRLKSNRLAMFSLMMLVALLIGAIFIPAVFPKLYYQTHLHLKNQPPSSVFLFGSDELGRSVFGRVWYGARISLFIGFTAAFIDMIIGVLVGALAGLSSSRIETFIMRFLDILHAIPKLMIVILLMVLLGQGIVTLLIAMTLTGWINMARIIRGQILQLKEQEYVLAAKVIGASNIRIFFRHLLPNLFGTIITTVTLTIPPAIFTEAFLSFLGLGIPAPEASWGTMAADGLPAFRYFPWRLFFPAIFISVTILSFNLIGDALKEAFDPRGDL